MAHVDPRFTMISRRSLSRTKLPNLYLKMIDGLKSFCSLAKSVSLTLALWTDRKQRAFFVLTDNKDETIIGKFTLFYFHWGCHH